MASSLRLLRIALLPRDYQSMRRSIMLPYHGVGGRKIPRMVITTTTTTTARRTLTTNNNNINNNNNSQGEEAAELSTNVTMMEKARAGSRLLLWGGIFAVASVCAYYIGRELLPSKLSPNGAFNETFARVRDHPELIKWLGKDVKGYGRDLGGSREGRRNFIDHDEFTDDDGVQHIRIKFNVEGSLGKGVVYSELAKNAPVGHFEYIIFERPRGQGVIALEDHRRQLTREEIQEKVAKKLAKNDTKVFGHINCQYTARQKLELGEHFEKIKYVACDRPENVEECKNANLKGYPTWHIGGQPLPGGFRSLEDLQQTARLLS